jgi:hypothetical protein
MADNPGRRSLHDRTADEIRNEQRGRAAAPTESRPEDGPEANATMRKLWSEPGGEAYNLRNATKGAGGEADGHDELTASETPKATRHLSDATLEPGDRDATGEAIARATSVNGDDEEQK